MVDARYRELERLAQQDPGAAAQLDAMQERLLDGWWTHAFQTRNPIARLRARIGGVQGTPGGVKSALVCMERQIDILERDHDMGTYCTGHVDRQGVYWNWRARKINPPSTLDDHFRRGVGRLRRARVELVVPQVVRRQIEGLLADWTCETDGMGDTLAERINCGECGAFADELVDRLVEEEKLNAFTVATDDFLLDACTPTPHDVEGVHIWTYVVETQRHYDAEAPQGVRDWLDLPFFARWRQRHLVGRRDSRDVEHERLLVTGLAWKRCRQEIRRMEGR